MRHLKTQSADLHDKILRLDLASRQKQLLVHGFEEKTGETEEQLEQNILEYFAEYLKLDKKDVNTVLDQVYRLGSRSPRQNKPRVVLINFVKGKDKQKVWAERTRRKRTNSEM